MIRLTLAIAVSLAVAIAATWLVTLPGSVDISAFGYRLRPSLGMAIGALLLAVAGLILFWAILRQILGLPGLMRRFGSQRRQKKGVDALSDAILSLEAGDPAKARQYAREARTRLGDPAGARMLEANAAVALGDWREARGLFREMIDDPRTAIAALAGLFEQARAQGRTDAALTFARKAAALSPELEWSREALLAEHLKRDDWNGALEMVRSEPVSGKDGRQVNRRRQAVLLTAIARDKETADPAEALDRARDALRLVPDFVPAALIAARIMINQGDNRHASGLLRRAWRATGHPHTALLFANVQPGASALERFRRMKALVEDPGANAEAASVLARAAIDAHEWSLARNALARFSVRNPAQGICLLMAEIEEGQTGDQGKAREWLSRAVRAPRDPSWIADGVVAEEWGPVSPVTGKLDAFEWASPPATLPGSTSTSEPTTIPAPAPAAPKDEAPAKAENA